MTPELRLQMDRQKALISTLNEVSTPAPDIRDQVIAEQRVQIKDLQDELYNQQCIALSNSGPTWLNREPEDDNGDYARGLRV